MLRVRLRTSYSYRLQVTGYRLQFTVTCYRLQVTGYRLQVTGYRLQVTGYRLQVTGYNYRLQVTVTGYNYRLQVTVITVTQKRVTHKKFDDGRQVSIAEPSNLWPRTLPLGHRS